MTSSARGQQPPSRASAVLLAVLLLASGMLVGFVPVVGVVRAADSSATTAVVSAAFVAVLPGVLAVILALRQPLLGLAATAGAGLVGAVRLLADLAVLTEVDRVTRPELFAETSERARPFTTLAGGWLLVLADLLWLVVGIVAAVRLASAVGLADRGGPGAPGIFGSPERSEPDATPELTTPDLSTADAAVALSDGHGRVRLNLPLIGVGFAGAVLLLVGALGTPYTGGYLDLRVLPFGSSLTALVAAVAIGFLAAVAVVVAAAMPPSSARALLAGTALAAAVPGLTAVVAVLDGARTSLSPVVWCGLLGAALVAGAGLLTRRGRPAGDSGGSAVVAPGRWWTLGTGVLAILAALALAAASRTSLLNLDGVAPDDIAGAALAPARPQQLVAAVPLAAAGVVALVRPVAAAGRSAVAIVWAGAVYAFGQSLWAQSLILSTVGDATATDHVWTTGAGLWWCLLGTALALAAAVLAILTSRRVADASPEVFDDLSVEQSRGARRWPAFALSVVIVLALGLPAYQDLTGPAPSLLHGYDLDTWGFWALAAGGIAGVWAAALSKRPAPAVAFLLASAGVVGQPLLVPAPLRDVVGFGLALGFWVGLAALVLLLLAIPYFARQAGRVGTVDRRLLGSRSTAIRRAKAESKGRS